MGKKAQEVRRATVRTIRGVGLTDEERDVLRAKATYEGSPHHKKRPGDFGFIPPVAPRPDKTMCDEAGVHRRSTAQELLERAIAGGIVSEATVPNGMPKHLWAVDDSGQVFEAMYGGATEGRYHGYPIRRNDPLFREVSEAWGRRR
jgi:hypothetical protein